MAFYTSWLIGFVTGVVLLAGMKFFQQKRSKHRVSKAVNLAMLSSMDREDLQRLIKKEIYPSWVQFHEYERVRWLNQQLAELWPSISKAASDLMKSTVEDVMEQYRPAIISSLKFSKLTIGTISPQINGIKIDESSGDEIVLLLDFLWGGNPSIILAIKTVVGLQLSVQVKDLKFQGVFRVALSPLVNTIPCFGAVVFALTKKPYISFTLKVAGGDISSVPGLQSSIDGAIRAAVTDSLLWPMRHVIPIIPGDYSHLEMHEEGVLEAKLVEGRDLLNVELVGTVDPYSTLFVRPIPSRVVRSRTMNNTRSPLWNNLFEMLVEDMESQRLVVQVWNQNDLGASTLIGEVAVPLTEVPPLELVDTWFPLVKDVDDPKADTTPRGAVRLELLFKPSARLTRPASATSPSSTSFRLSSQLDDNEEERERREGAHGAQQNGYSPAGDGGEQDEVAAMNPFLVNPAKGKYIRGVMQVHVVSGHDLVAKDYNGLSDPFVELEMQLGGQRKKSQVKWKTLNPEWNERFDFMVEDARHDMLIVSVFDHDMLGMRDKLGRAAVTLTRVVMKGTHEEEYQLMDVAKGWIKLRLVWKQL